ncbi:MAG: hypothetical protein LBR38_06800, partial [Synergistaceae bacterium]|nr:hypothetical protein [Synergistaceae bacterium]
LEMIESAVSVYRGCDRLAAPDSVDARALDDYSFVDIELMRDSLERYGMLARPGKNPCYKNGGDTK